MKIAHTAFLDLENGLASRSNAAWKKVWANLSPLLESAIRRKNWESANKLVDSLDLTPIIESSADYAQTIGLASLLLGASRSSDIETSFISKHPPTRQLQNGVTQWGWQVARNIPKRLMFKLHKQLAALEHQAELDRHTITKFDPDEARDDYGKWTSSGGGLGTEGKFEGQVVPVPDRYQDFNLVGQLDSIEELAEKAIKASHPERNHDDDPEWAANYNKMDNLWTAAGLARAAITADYYQEFPFSKFVAIDPHGKVQGAVYGHQASFDKTAAYISALASFQRGAGSRLLHEFEHWASGKGYKKVILSPTKFAVPFYQHEGYTKRNEGEMIKSLDSTTPIDSVGKADLYVEPIGALTIRPEWATQSVRKEAALDTDNISQLMDSIELDGTQFMSLAASLMVSRLSSFGFLAEAKANGVQYYEISAILDDHTCPVCEALDGKRFPVDDGIRQATAIMDAEDPDSLASIAPWPSQKSDSVDDISDSDAQDLVDMGLQLPPYHPLCRCITIESDDEQSAATNTESDTAQDAEGLAEDEQEGDMPLVSMDALDYLLKLVGLTTAEHELLESGSHMGIPIVAQNSSETDDENTPGEDDYELDQDNNNLDDLNEDDYRDDGDDLDTIDGEDDNPPDPKPKRKRRSDHT